MRSASLALVIGAGAPEVFAAGTDADPASEAPAGVLDRRDPPAGSERAEEADVAPDAKGSVDLDRLLQLPSSMQFDDDKRNGASQDVWRTRFRASFREIRAAEEQIAETRRALDEAAGSGGGGQWQMAPPGANNTEVTPISFKLREDLRKGRERLDEAERKHRELVIQADLADVPAEWRQPE